MNNYERIKSMTVDEMARYIHSKAPCIFCVYEDCNQAEGCISGIKQWLLSEVRDE